MKMKEVRNWILMVALVACLAACASTPMTMRSVVEPGQLRTIGNVLIVTNGDLFPDIMRQGFFDPSAAAIRRMFLDAGVKAWVIEADRKSLNPAQAAALHARQLEASHILFFSADKVVSFGPRNSPVEYSKQQRLISSYELTFVLTDLSAGRNVWKGTLQSGSDYNGDEAEARLVRDGLRAQLTKIGVMPVLQRSK